MTRTIWPRTHTPPPGSASQKHGTRRLSRCAVVVLATVLPLVAASSGLLEVTVPDATITEVDARPSASDPGPVMHSGADGLTYSSGSSNVELALYAELTAVTNNASASSATVQGTSHTFLDWFYAKQGGASKYATLNATGVYDSDAGAYTVPVLFTKSSQGSLQITSYDGTTPTTPTTTTYYWAYDAVVNDYVFGTSKNLGSATKIDPISNTLGVTFQFTLDTNKYVVTGNAGAGANYVPTITQGHHAPLLSLPASKTWYLMMDPPAGIHEDTYQYTLRVTANGL